MSNPADKENVVARITESHYDQTVGAACGVERDSVCLEIVDENTDEVIGNTNVILLADDDD